MHLNFADTYSMTFLWVFIIIHSILSTICPQRLARCFYKGFLYQMLTPLSFSLFYTLLFFLPCVKQSFLAWIFHISPLCIVTPSFILSSLAFFAQHLTPEDKFVARFSLKSPFEKSTTFLSWNTVIVFPKKTNEILQGFLPNS